MNLHLGIDPGSRDLGWALLSEDRSYFKSGTFCYKDHPHTGVGTQELFASLDENIPEGAKIVSAALERYVPYSGKFTSNAEAICEIIGSIGMVLTQRKIKYLTVRAIDWKTLVVKMLFLLERFTNPSDKLDKEFSIAAANHIIGGKYYKTNHEADGFGLAFYTLQLHSRKYKGYHEPKDSS